MRAVLLAIASGWFARAAVARSDNTERAVLLAVISGIFLVMAVLETTRS